MKKEYWILAIIAALALWYYYTHTYHILPTKTENPCDINPC